MSGCGPSCSKFRKEQRAGRRDPCASCPLTQFEIHPLTEIAVNMHAQLTGGPLGRERYRLTRTLVSRAEADFVFQMTEVCEEIMRAREAAQREDAAKAAGR